MNRDAAAPRISIGIIDDDASVRVSLQRLCEVYDFKATGYASGLDFLASLDDTRPQHDCLLLDAHMPGMTGSELHRTLITLGVRIPTIVITADDAPDVSAHYGPAGIVAYLRKPLACEDLMPAIEQAVRGGRIGT